MRNKSALTICLMVTVLLSLGVAAVAPTLTFTFKDVKVKGATEVDSYAINDKGVIAGDYDDSSGVQHGLILNGTKVTSFDNSNCQNTGDTTGSIAAFGINTAGDVAGWCFSTKNGNAIGWVYSKGKFTTIAYPKATQTEATGINDKGDVVGLYVDSAGTAHGFKYVSKKYSAINVKGAAAVAAWGINNSGEISVEVGAGFSGGLLEAPLSSYLLKGTKLTTLKDPNQGSDGTVVHAISNKGDVDGTYYDSAGNTHGCLLHGGKYYNVEDPKGANLTRDDGLNSSLTMVGRYTPSAGGNVGFEATTK